MNIFSKTKLITILAACFFLPYCSISQIIYTETSNSPQSLGLDSYHFTEKAYITKMDGSSYIYEDWQLADIKMTTDSAIIKDVFVKIDVLNSLIEIKDVEEIKVLPAYLTSFLKLKEKNEIFITKNALGNYLLNGFSKLLYNGKTSLMCNYSATIKEPNYNIALDVGKRDNELILVKKYFLFIKNELIAVEKNKKRFLNSFSYNIKIQEFIKEKKISPKNETDLILLLSYIDSIN